jgi:DNA polymerase III delta prime subunit
MECNTLFVNKYKPIYFDDFFMENNTILILKKLIMMDNLNIMLIGNIASGKTSLLNSIIKEYYAGILQKDYEENILYINSLKEQGINYYRNDVKTFCQTCSNIPNKKKVIILDDIDLINEQSQQVFRNCIDKYSHNVYFISSCYNKQKIIESIQSRFTLIKIESVNNFILTKVFNKIKYEENIIIDKPAEEFIINISNNTIKILINYMEKFKLFNQPITYELANNLCTNISFLILENFTILIKTYKLTEAIKIIYEIVDKGYSVMDILDNYFVFVKNTKILTENEKYKFISIICKYISIFHNLHEDEIELSFFTNNLINCLE